MDYITVYRNSVAGIKRKFSARKVAGQRAGRAGCMPGSNCVDPGYVQMSAPVRTDLRKWLVESERESERPPAFMSPP